MNNKWFEEEYKKFEEESLAESNMDNWNWNKAQELIEIYLALKKNQEWGILPQSKDTLEDELQAMQTYKGAMEAYQKAGGFTTVEIIEDPAIPVPSLMEEPKKRKINFDD